MNNCVVSAHRGKLNSHYGTHSTGACSDTNFCYMWKTYSYTNSQYEYIYIQIWSHKQFVLNPIYTNCWSYSNPKYIAIMLIIYRNSILFKEKTYNNTKQHYCIIKQKTRCSVRVAVLPSVLMVPFVRKHCAANDKVMLATQCRKQ